MFHNTISGNRIWYQLQGSGMGILIIHGLGGDLETMMPISQNIQANFTKVLVDAPCHGKSDDFGITLEELGSELISLMENIGFREFYSVGISMGSIILEEMMLDHGENMTKNVLISPASEIDSVIVNKVASWAASENRVSIDVLSESYLSTHKKEVDAYDRDHPMKPERLYPLIPSLMNFSVSGRHSDSECLLLVAQHDSIFGERMSADLRDTFRNSSVVLMNSGHAIHRENPLEAARIISEYFGS
ncbi:MAG: alpha/beta fold hydrolase [Thermoplasmataceae archaeon]